MVIGARRLEGELLEQRMIHPCQLKIFYICSIAKYKLKYRRNTGNNHRCYLSANEPEYESDNATFYRPVSTQYDDTYNCKSIYPAKYKASLCYRSPLSCMANAFCRHDSTNEEICSKTKITF